MYHKAQLFEARMKKIASDSLLMDRSGTQSGILGDPNKEYYDAQKQTGEGRQKLHNLLQEVLSSRRVSADLQERAELFRLEKRIMASLRAGKKMTAKHKHTLSQVFMNVAEQTLNHEVFKAIVARTHDLYHSPENITT